MKSKETKKVFFVRHFSLLSVIVLDKDRNRPAKRCQVAGYVFKRLINIHEIRKIEVFYEIVDFCVLDICSKPISVLLKNCPERQNLLEVARTAKSCSKRQKLLNSSRAQSGQAKNQTI